MGSQGMSNTKDKPNPLSNCMLCFAKYQDDMKGFVNNCTDIKNPPRCSADDKVIFSNSIDTGEDLNINRIGGPLGKCSLCLGRNIGESEDTIKNNCFPLPQNAVPCRASAPKRKKEKEKNSY